MVKGYRTTNPFSEMVQPGPAPVSTNAELRSSNMDTGRSQKLMLFNRGNRLRIVLSYKLGLSFHLIFLE
jgi:hypothetical protein